MSIKTAIETVSSGHDLDAFEAEKALEEIMQGKVSDINIAAFLIALRTKGETTDELVGLASAMRKLGKQIDLGKGLLDTAGTGGGQQTFNVSTAAALIAAGAGAKIAKHGNRSYTTSSGSADVLEALGAKLELDETKLKEAIQKTGFVFLFAPYYYAAAKYVAPARHELGIKTVFNLLGPLCNPASAEYQVIGVSDIKYSKQIAQTLARLGTTRTLVVSSVDGLDEISVSAPTIIWQVDKTAIQEYLFDPQDLGLQNVDIKELQGGSPQDNARIIKQILEGETSAKTDMACVNAGAALYAAHCVPSIKEGYLLARETVTSGKANQVLNSYIELSNS